MNNENLPQVIKENILVRIKNWFKRFIFKKEKTTEKVIEGDKNIKLDKSNFIEELKVEDNTEILKIQNNLKLNKIKISDLTDTQLQKMIELYKMQIEKKEIKLKQYRKILLNGN